MGNPKGVGSGTPAKGIKEQTHVDRTRKSNQSTHGNAILGVCALLSCVLCLAGCFVFNNPFDTGSPPAIGLAPTSLSFSATAGGANPIAQTVAVNNTGGGTLSGLGASVIYTNGSGWLSTPSLSTTTAPATLKIQPSTGSLAAGIYTATVSVASSLSDVSAQKVRVTFTISPTATFQIVISSTNYGGTYIWNPLDSAYEAIVGGARYYVYTDSSNYWCFASQLNQTYNTGSIAYSLSINGTLPPRFGSGWSGAGAIIAGIDDSEGGICLLVGPPDGTLSPGAALQVVYLASNLGDSATCQWQRSSSSLKSSFDPPTSIWTGSICTLQSGDYARWIRVIITPIDSTGTIPGTPVVSQPVFLP